MGYLISTARQSLKGMQIGLDCANGASSAFAKSVFDAIGARTYVIHNEPDVLNVNVDCGSIHIEAMQAYVRKEKLDAGFAFDGDADRCIAVDEKGQVVDGDRILYICGSYLKEKGSLAHDTVVATVMSNLGLHRALARKGIFSQLTEDYKTYPQKLLNVRVKDKLEVQENPVLRKRIETLEEEFDGDGRILVRASGTEPLVRLLVEAPDMRLCERCMDELLHVMKEQGLCE